ncbi:HesA/MoeB/ThiF family protein [Streptococcus pneumoniae]|uniref:HesA/MoeB/ThiF family protein n=4 Tax=Streptococcus pneumoniae TaxID=1313 RepID=A0A4I9PEN3_STREE|nr:ThiF family adenylyltransferase [Streptococcus pneumoniae]ELU57499.1 ThiF family protein [Streptococcus pneumoniae PCS8203]ELU58524.1 ThiF family protein [Streptococcus pneumoniae PCS8106]EMQ91799.1 ThiF family protein [Streptococcus pneumoniae PCS8235]MBW8133013.1 ThiF family adenylyltransferase [Streptococcus pneumoniae]MDA5267985.1 hypothetical protein [Streptococcus pneumoniae]
MKLYQINDGIQIFESSNLEKIVIRNYRNGKKITIDHQPLLKKLLLFLEVPKREEEILLYLPELSNKTLRSVLTNFMSLNIIHCQDTLIIHKKINILIIGLGTTGGYLADGLCRSNINSKLFLLDKDRVDETNVGRQIYLRDDIGQYKVDVFKQKFSDKEIKVFKIFINSKKDLEKICKREGIDLVIQCGDSPSPRELGKIVNTVCDTLQIPYIVNTGYMSNVVPLPEFYYPNNRYNFNYKHQFSDEKLLFSQVLSKADYMVAIQSSFVMLMQIKNFIFNEEPIYYGYRGYYNSVTLAWEVEKID